MLLLYEMLLIIEKNIELIDNFYLLSKEIGVSIIEVWCEKTNVKACRLGQCQTEIIKGIKKNGFATFNILIMLIRVQLSLLVVLGILVITTMLGTPFIKSKLAAPIFKLVLQFLFANLLF